MPFILAALSRAGLWLAEAADTHSATLCSGLYQLRFHPAAPAEQCQGSEGRFQPSIITRTSTSFTGRASPPPSSACSLLFMKPERFSSTA